MTKAFSLVIAFSIQQLGRPPSFSLTVRWSSSYSPCWGSRRAPGWRGLCRCSGGTSGGPRPPDRQWTDLRWGMLGQPRWSCSEVASLPSLLPKELWRKGQKVKLKTYIDVKKIYIYTYFQTCKWKKCKKKNWVFKNLTQGEESPFVFDDTRHDVHMGVASVTEQLSGVLRQVLAIHPRGEGEGQPAPILQDEQYVIKERKTL